MNTRYNNPHQQYQQLQEQLRLQQQLAQQQRNLQQGNQMNQINPQALLAWMQNNPHLMAAFMQQTGGQPGMMQQPMMMQPGMMTPQQMMVQGGHQQFVPQQTNQRFPMNNNVGNEQGLYQNQPNQQQNLSAAPSCTRYGAQTEQEQEPEPEASGISEFIVNNKSVAVPLTKKLTITPKVTAFNHKLLSSIQEVCFSFSLEDAIEELVTKSKEVEGEKLLFTIDSVVINDAFKTPFDPGYTKLFSDDVKALYKRLRGLYETATTMDTVIMLERVDKLMTAATNHYLKINFDDQLNIDRFSTDFNDLLKILRTDFEDEEDDLWEHLSKEILEIYKLLESDEHQKYEFSVIKPVTVVYFKDHHYKAGLKDVSSTMVKLPAVPHNEFLISTAMAMKELSDRISFYMATYDRNVYRFSINKKNEVFVELVG